MGDFDAADRDSWYCGPLRREEANGMLLKVQEPGVFFVRDSTTIKGDFVLCVRESQKVSHYIIHKTNVHGQIKFKIGEQEFPDLASLLNFYKTHYLDTTSLTRPLPKECVEARWNFDGNDEEDLPFRKGEVLTVLRKAEEEWWLARNADGKRGLIPANYVIPVDLASRPTATGSNGLGAAVRAAEVPADGGAQPANIRLPCRARCIQDRNPSAYDPSQLKFKVGDIIIVRSMNVNGQWEGELEGTDRKGVFPFTHVSILPETEATLGESGHQ